jgi:hypothetical protein
VLHAFADQRDHDIRDGNAERLHPFDLTPASVRRSTSAEVEDGSSTNSRSQLRETFIRI